MYVETNQKEERSDSMFSFFKSEKMNVSILFKGYF